MLKNALHTIENIIIGKPMQIQLALCCLLAKGHLLVEDVPGVGKTTLAHSLATALGLEYQRIQFTSDLLPADILGVSVYDRNDASFRFHKGPIFTQLILADEINRATPRAQSALLEAMEEGQITSDGTTYSLPNPFFVVATQNPQNQIGTYALPESQLDRFLMKIEIGYPDADAEKKLLRGENPRDRLKQLKAAMTADDLIILQAQVNSIHCSDALIDYVQAILTYSRNCGHWAHGLSPRAGVGLLRASRAWALLQNRKQVLPEDVQAVLASVVTHRLESDDSLTRLNPAAVLIKNIAIP